MIKHIYTSHSLLSLLKAHIYGMDHQIKSTKKSINDLSWRKNKIKNYDQKVKYLVSEKLFLKERARELQLVYAFLRGKDYKSVESSCNLRPKTCNMGCYIMNYALISRDFKDSNIDTYVNLTIVLSKWMSGDLEESIVKKPDNANIMPTHIGRPGYITDACL